MRLVQQKISIPIFFTALTDISNPVGNQDRYNNLHCVFIYRAV
jgi:hypothetical protein